LSERPADRPARELDAGRLTLVAFRGGETDGLTRLVAANIDHLRPWMPWAGTAPSRAAQDEFVRRSIAEWDAGENFNYWMREEETGEMVGCAGLHSRAGQGALEIGYWVSAARVRRGYATAAAQALTTAAFTMSGIDRVEIHCDEANVASASVPRKLGYRLVRVEDRPVEAPGETGRQMVWVIDAVGWSARRDDAGVRASS
jgi:RimJ/RimL family protein N-acetyltransferase